MSSYLEFLKSPKDSIVVPFIDTIMRSAPDSMVIGSILLAIITQSYSLAVLSFTFLEITVFQNLIASFSKWVAGTTGGPIEDNCGFQIPSYTQVSLLKQFIMKAPFPSAPIFFMSSCVAYFLGAQINVRNEINTLASDYPLIKAGFPISSVLSVIFIVSLLMWRVVRGCDGFLVGFGSIVFGFLVGTLLLLLNTKLMGRDSINFGGLPLLIDKLQSGKDLYVCSQTNDIKSLYDSSGKLLP
jgi:hypothetical protein